MDNSSENLEISEKNNSNNQNNPLSQLDIQLHSLETLPLKNTNSTNDNIPNKDNNQSNSEVINIPEIELTTGQSTNFKKEDTLNESILKTISRDLYLIYTKLKFVIIPFGSIEQKSFHIKQWDLWGPLLLNTMLACTLAMKSEDKSQIVILIFAIFWIGSFILFLNANFLGVKSSIYQMICLVGYCLFPLNVSALIVAIFNIHILIKFCIVGITCFWSIFASCDFIKTITEQGQKYLVLYPFILFYLYLSWFILSN